MSLTPTPVKSVTSESELCHAIHAGKLVLCLSNRQRLWCLNLWEKWLAQQPEALPVVERPSVYTLHDWLWAQQRAQLSGVTRADEACQYWAWLASRKQSLSEKGMTDLQLQRDLVGVARRFDRACEEWQVPVADPFWNHEHADLYRRWSGNANRLLEEKGLVRDNQLLSRLVADTTQLPLPPMQEVVLVGWVFINPLLETLLNAWQKQGVELVSWQMHEAIQQDYQLLVTGQGDAMDQVVAHAAQQAADLWRQGKRVLVVVPDLATRWLKVFTAFWSAFAPQQNTHACLLDGERPFNLSGGVLLAKQPPIAVAMKLLALHSKSPMDQVIPLLYNPAIDWLDGCNEASETPVTLLAQLWQQVASLPLGALTQAWGRRFLPSALQNWHWPERAVASIDHTTVAWPSEWVEEFDAHLSRCGWMYRVSQDSYDYQLMSAFTELLQDMIHLDGFGKKITRNTALTLLEGLLEHRLFQPRPSESELDAAPVQVLAGFEAFGLGFDHSIVCGLDGDNLANLQKQHIPLPLSVMREFSMPGSSQQKVYQDSEIFWRGLASTAPQLTLCHAQRNITSSEDELPRNFFCTGEPHLVTLPPQAVFHSKLLTETNEKAQPLALPRVNSSTVKAQSCCGWQGWWAFAKLDMDEPKPQLYPSPAWRGQVLHKALAELLGEAQEQCISSLRVVKEQQPDAEVALRSLVTKALGRALRFYARRAPMLGEAMEKVYLRYFTNVLVEWLKTHEQAKVAPFSCEREYKDVVLGKLTARSIRIDRIDKLDDELVVIDYKTGTPGSLNLHEERIADPQLLLYAAALRQQHESIAALAYARIAPPYEQGWKAKGSVKAKTYFSTNNTPAKQWQEQLDEAITQLEQRLNCYADGTVMLDPIANGKEVCKYCTLKASCRFIAQKHNTATPAH